MTNLSRSMAAGLALSAGLALGETALHAAPALYFLDTATMDSVTIVDGGVNDLNSAAGAVSWMGQVGNWHISLGSGFSDRSGGVPSLDLASGTVSSGAAGTLIIRLSDTGFGPSFGAVSSSIGGNSTGNVSYSAFADPANTLITSTVPGTAVTLVGPTSAGGSPFSRNDSGFLNLAGPYSLTQEADITVAGAGSASFDFNLNVTPVPEPSTLSLLALAGLGFAAWSRRSGAQG